MHKALIVGGGSGIGLAMAQELAKKCHTVVVVDKKNPGSALPHNVMFQSQDLLLTDYAWLSEHDDADVLFYSAGFGRVTHFENLAPKEIENLFRVNTESAFRTLHHFMPKLKSGEDFLCAVMVSIAGRISSPLFSMYSASKAALFRGLEAINTELKMAGTSNRILEISPGSIKGTSFSGGPTQVERLKELANAIIDAMTRRETLLIPEYESVYKDVLTRYQDDPEKFASESYDYKIKQGRLQVKPQLTVGYLSGTFDLFHIGHLNMLRRARQHCDYLVVGVHKDASHKGKQTFIPFEERVEIIRSIKYVDKVIPSEKEDSDVYTKNIVKYDKLFVGSDYKGSERFNRYEEYFKDKGVEIIYFPYTQGTSSTQLREALTKK